MKLLRRSLFVSLFTAASLVCGYSIAPAAVNDPVAELDAFITRTLKEYQVPGAAIAVVRDGKVALLKGYGVPRKKRFARSGRALEFLEPAFRQEIHRGRQCDHDQGERRGDEGRGDGREINENGDDVFARHFFVQPLELGFVVMTGNR